MLIDFSGFLVCTIVIFFAGKNVARYGDMIAELTGLGRAWIGLLLMAGVTSLPELMVGISSAAIIRSADLAVGDILGSCAFNLCILAVLDCFLPRHRRLLGNISQSQLLAASLGIILVTLAGVGIFLREDIVITPGIGITSVSFAVLYLFSIRLIHRYGTKNKCESGSDAESDNKTGLTLRQVILRYSAFALLIILAALTLPHFADNIAEGTGLGKSFVGTLFLAASTSLPEIAVSIAAIRMGSVDLAAGNLFGSNIFNIFILFIDDLFYTNGHILKDASDLNLLSALSVIIMSAIAIIGISFRAEKKRYFFAMDAFLIFAVYVMNMVLLYKLS